MKRILIIGAGEAGRMVAEEVASSPDLNVEIVAFLDDDPSLQGQQFKGIKVVGAANYLPELAQKEKLDEVIIAIPSAGGSLIRRLLKLCWKVGLPIKLIPGIREIIKGDAHFYQVRPINPEDLLGRETVDIVEPPVRKLLTGNKVMVTGAGGSIGSEIVRQVAAMKPSLVMLLGRGENSIFEIKNELRNSFPELEAESIIADIRDRDGLIRLGKHYKPQIIYHAAAHKHVHFMERFPREAYINNVQGTRNVIDMAQAAEASHMVMLSSDKAVDPGGIMGASKRLAELLMIRAHQAGTGTRFLSVRFGNVLGSRGSVVSLFMNQIRCGSSVTVTDPKATRYFMTIREASMLVIQASSIGKGGEIFILNMGERVGILELARSLILMSGYKPVDDIPIEFTGLRPGEKLHEKLMTSVEEEASEIYDKLVILRPKLPDKLKLASFLKDMDRLVEKGKDKELAGKFLRFSNGLLSNPQAAPLAIK